MKESTKSRYQNDPIFREKNREYSRKWYYENKERLKTHASRNNEYVNKQTRERRYEWKRIAYDKLDNSCSRCGFKDARALQIDHINAGGNAARRDKAKSRCYLGFYKAVASMENPKEQFQLLCANCNTIKRWDNDEHNQYACAG